MSDAGAAHVAPFRWGIVGYGWVARDHMAPGIAASGGVVAAVCDPDPQARALAASRGARAHADLAGLLSEALDAVYVATPNHLHREAVEACAAAGVPVLTEKPLAATLADAEAMVSACAQAGVLLGAAFDQRRHPAHRTIRDLLAAGGIGTVTAVRIVYACWLGREWSPGEGCNGANWRIDARQAGGGAVMDLAPHGIDLVDALLGEPLVELSGLLQTRVQDYAVDDGGVLVGRTAGGVLATIHNSYNTPEGLPRRRLEVVGSTGQVVALDTMGQTAGGSVTVIDGATGAATPVAFDAAASPFAEQARAFQQAVRGGTHDFDASRDLAGMRLLAGLYAGASFETRPAGAPQDDEDGRSAPRGVSPARQAEERAEPASRSPHPSGGLQPYACANCGFWQVHFAPPPDCPVCTDVRNDLPEDGWRFLSEVEVAASLTGAWRRVADDLVAFTTAPRLGLDGTGWLLLRPEGNVAFEAAPYYTPPMLEEIRRLGGIAVIAASHCHGYGALWRLQREFGAPVAIQREDLRMTKAFRVTDPYDEMLELGDGLTLHHVGGHYEGQACLHDARGRRLFCGDMFKVDQDAAGRSTAVSSHKAFHKHIPLTHGELRRYREVIAPLEFDAVLTPFEYAPEVGRGLAVALLDEGLSRPPGVRRIPI